jgi:3-oxoacyl-[acyl-carrier-protein] synthase III
LTFFLSDICGAVPCFALLDLFLSEMSNVRKVPIVVGVGDIKNKSLIIKDAVEPMQLMLKATQLAIADTNLSPSASKQLQSNIDSISIVATWTWNYHDLPGLIGDKLGVKPKYKILSEHGGNSPAKLFDEAARQISFGQAKVALVTGGEALASCEYALMWWK